MPLPKSMGTLVQHRLDAPIAIVMLAAMFYAPVLLGYWTFPLEGRSGAFSPLAERLLLLTRFSSNPALRLYLLQLEMVLVGALGGIFMASFSGFLTGSRGAGLLGGSLFMLSGYLTGALPQEPALAPTAIWLPWILLMLARGWQEPARRRWWVGAGGAVALALAAGHGPTLLVMACAAFAWLVVQAKGGAPRRGWRDLVGMTVATVSGGGVGALAGVLSRLTGDVDTPAGAQAVIVGRHMAWEDMWQVMLPGVLTPVSPLHVGVVAVGLAVVALMAMSSGSTAVREDGANCTGKLPWRVGVGFLAILGGLALPLAWLVPGGAGLAWTVAMAGLAAYGYALLPHLHRVVRRRAALITGALVVGAVYGFGALRQLVGASAVDHATYLGIALVTLLLGMAVALLIWLPEPEAAARGLTWTRRRILLVGFGAFSLLWANFGVGLDRVPLNVRAATTEPLWTEASTASWAMWISTVVSLTLVAVMVAVGMSWRRWR